MCWNNYSSELSKPQNLSRSQENVFKGGIFEGRQVHWHFFARLFMRWNFASAQTRPFPRAANWRGREQGFGLHAVNKREHTQVISILSLLASVRAHDGGSARNAVILSQPTCVFFHLPFILHCWCTLRPKARARVNYAKGVWKLHTPLLGTAVLLFQIFDGRRHRRTCIEKCVCPVMTKCALQFVKFCVHTSV